jgi:small subunit ribosomal protein S6
MAPVYDLMLLLDPRVADDRRREIVGNVENAITSQGSLVGRHDWGTRAMAYAIRHQPEADYHLLQFHGPPELLELLQRTLRITDGVVRFRLIKLRPGTPEPPAVRSEPRPAEAPAPAAAEPAPEQPAPEQPAAEEPPAEEPAPEQPAPAE